MRETLSETMARNNETKRSIMIKFTICFIKQADKILLLNRENPSWMGMWNGVGGKLEANETPRESIIREIKEETGIAVEHIHFKGLVTWSVDRKRVGGMYTYLVELPLNYQYECPLKSDEGILDWKEIRWILHSENRGVAYYIPRSLEKILSESICFEHRCFYEDGQLVKYEFKEINEGIENITDQKTLERIFCKYFEEGHGIR
jgi:8-oxo-dGTP diphosphatase